MKEKSRSISTNFIYNFVRTFAGTIFPVITFSYSSRILGAEGIGKLSFSKSIISYFSLFAMLGIHHYGTREVAKLRNDRRQLSKFAQEMLILNGVTTLLAYCALAITISVSVMLQQYTVLLWITSLSIFFMAMGMEWLYQGLEEYRYISLRSITFQIIAVSIMLLTVRDKSDLAAYAIVSLVAVCNGLARFCFVFVFDRLGVKTSAISVSIITAAAVLGIFLGVTSQNTMIFLYAHSTFNFSFLSSSSFMPFPKY